MTYQALLDLVPSSFSFFTSLCHTGVPVLWTCQNRLLLRTFAQVLPFFWISFFRCLVWSVHPGVSSEGTSLTALSGISGSTYSYLIVYCIFFWVFPLFSVKLQVPCGLGFYLSGSGFLCTIWKSAWCIESIHYVFIEWLKEWIFLPAVKWLLVFGFNQLLNSEGPVRHVPLNMRAWEEILQDDKNIINKESGIIVGQWCRAVWDLNVFHIKGQSDNLHYRHIH